MSPVGSESFNNAWAPIILPVGIVSPPVTSREQELQLAIDSLGYPQTHTWQSSLRVANALSTGEHKRVASVAASVGIQQEEVRERVSDLRSLFGDWPVPRLLDYMFQQQFLGFEVKGQPPDLETDVEGALVGILLGETPDMDATEALYTALDSAPTPSAAVRRAYELQLRIPVGVSQARRIGFHMLRGTAVPSSYPARTNQRSMYTQSRGMLQAALRGETEVVFGYGRRIPLQPADLAVPALAALGCTNQEIADRLHASPGLVASRLREVGLKAGLMRPERPKIVAHLLQTDLFFVSSARSDI